MNHKLGTNKFYIEIRVKVIKFVQYPYKKIKRTSIRYTIEAITDKTIAVMSFQISFTSSLLVTLKIWNAASNMITAPTTPNRNI